MGLLSRSAIESRSDEIFKDGTFDLTALRAAAYDLRIREDPELKHTGRLEGRFLHLDTGQRAVLETYECIAMPWNLAGNIGVKFRKGVEGLLVSPGLFVDPGFGWGANGEDGALQPTGARLRFMVTNVGKNTISIQLGPSGDHVIGIQFLEVAQTDPSLPVNPVEVDFQGLAFFENLTKIENDFGEVKTSAERTRSTTEMVAEFGSFLVALTLLGVVASFLFSVLAEGDAMQNFVKAVNELDGSRSWTLAFMLAVGVIAFGVVVALAVGFCKVLRRIVPNRS